MLALDRRDDIEIHPPVKRTREIALSAAWHGGLTRDLFDIDGTRIRVVFPGHWSHGFGPDFNDAMLEIPGRGLITGSIELHHDSSDWVRHGHHLDPRYNDVVLHVVSRIDSVETCTVAGSRIPMAQLRVPDEMLFRIDARLPGIWSDLGGEVCAEHLARSSSGILLSTVHRLGDQRLNERISRIEGDLQVETELNVLTLLLLDALGYSENRQPMQELALHLNRIGWAHRISRVRQSERADFAMGLLFGIAGYFPFSPPDVHSAGIDAGRVHRVERQWRSMASHLQGELMPATAWVRARTRPANHPAARLAIASSLLARICGNPVGEIIATAQDESIDIVAWIQQLGTSPDTASLGESRARAIAANVLLPFAIAIARSRGDDTLEEIASTSWQRLPASERSRPVKRALHQVAGKTMLRHLGERGHQGLIKLDRDFCTPRRCFECPIAADVVRDQLAQSQ